MPSILTRFRALVAQQPNKIVLSEGATGLTYQQLDQCSSALAHLLISKGLGPRDVFAFVKTGMVETYVAMLAGLKAGCGFIVPDVHEDAAKLKHLLDHARVDVCYVAGADGAAALAQIGRTCVQLDLSNLAPSDSPLPEPSLEAFAFVEPTSGSTGLPKLVYSTQRTVDYYTSVQLDHAGLGPNDRVAQLGETWVDTVMAALLSGASLHAFDFKAEGASALAAWMRDERITAVQTYVAAFRAMAEATREPLPDLRIVRLSGEAVLTRDVEAFERVCPSTAVLSNYFGATECGFVCEYRHVHGHPVPEGALPIGQPAKGTTLRIMDAEGADLPRGAVGLLEFTAPHLPEGYLHNPDRTAEVFGRHADGRRVLRSGDLGYLGDDGQFRMAGRADDQVKIRGYSVRYSDVESALDTIDQIAEAAVTSVVSPRGVRQLVAHVLLADGAAISVGDIRAELRTKVPNYLVPPHIMVHDTLPRTDTGKNLRRALPDPLSQMSVPAWDDFSVAERSVADVWASILGHRSFGPDEDFFDVGGDSLQAMSVVVALEDQLRVRVGYETLVMQGATVRGIAARLLDSPKEDIVVLTDKGTGRPLYVMPVENGEFSDWLYLVAAFVPDRPVLGVHARPQAQRQAFTYKTVEENAAYVADAILRHDPGGPHLIAGFSSGAQIGFEVAKVLEKRGVPPAGLMLVDPPVTITEEERHSWHIRRILSPLFKQGALRLTLNRAAHIIFRRPALELAIADECSFWRHRPTGQVASPTLLLSAIDLNPHKKMKERHWAAHIAGAPEIIDVTGDHITLVRDPHAPRLAKVMERWMNRISPP